ncbi:hypothetical protein ZIOFF_011767 [Zingiber officinale]|uniref:Uncharacterized protein n=1 Tax=Zingiber officinale TaxID=94328 RepID=A0A8J5HNJ6_ZINOF|nr:hypothetical protein ZIOFF_011767 [Zingiber officinale]
MKSNDNCGEEQATSASERTAVGSPQGCSYNSKIPQPAVSGVTSALGWISAHVIDPRRVPSVNGRDRRFSLLQKMKAVGVAAAEEEREMEAGKKRLKEGEIKSVNGKAEVYDVDEDGEEPEDVVELDDDDDDDGNVEGDDDDDDDDDEEDGGDDEDDDDVEDVTPHGFQPQAQAVDEDDDDEEEEEEGAEGGGDGDDDDDESDDDDGEGEEEEEELGTEYLVQPVGRPEDEEDASDFVPVDETDEDEDIDAPGGFGGSGSVKDGTVEEFGLVSRKPDTTLQLYSPFCTMISKRIYRMLMLREDKRYRYLLKISFFDSFDVHVSGPESSTDCNGSYQYQPRSVHRPLSQVYWMKDPKTGNWMPEDRFGDVDVAEQRARLLSCWPAGRASN